MATDRLAARLGMYISLTTAERAAIARLEAGERRVPRHHVLRRAGERTAALWVLQEGWAISCATLADGSRQIHSLHLPGDVLGLASAALRNSGDMILTIGPARLSTFDRATLQSLLAEHPRLSALLLLLAQAELAGMADRLTAMGRTSARARIGALLLSSLHRLRGLDPAVGTVFAFPLTQEQIGDMVGLTSVHVNRMMRALETEGVIVRHAGTIEILDEARLAAASHYVDRQSRLDTSWLPAATEDPATPSPAYTGADAGSAARSR